MSFQRFLQSENGAVTVDWVVLTAALVGLGLAAMAVVSGGIEDLSAEVSVELASLDTGSLYDWGSAGEVLSSVWGDLGIFSPRQTASQAEAYVASVLANNGGDYQAAYDQLYQQVLDMTYADGESIDDFGAFVAMAEANGAPLDASGDMSYAEMHAIYSANGSI